MPDPIPAPTPSPAQGDPRLFRLGLPDGPGLTRRVAARVAGPLEWLLSVDQLNDTYARCRGAAGLDAFLARVLESLDVRYRVAQPDLDRIPKAGPVVVVANHPFGALDGIVLAAVLRSVRPDVKVMANYLLGRIPDLRDLFILVDPFGGDGAAAANLGPVRQSLRWLKDRGGMLAAFPAGEVAHLNLRERAVTDPPWTDQIARIVRRTGAPVLPVYFDGHNGPLFQFLGMIHPRLRTAMLPRELYRKQHGVVELRVGSAIPHKRLAAIESDAALTDYLRRRTFLLQHRAVEPAPTSADRASTLWRKAADAAPARDGPSSSHRGGAAPEPIIEPVAPELLAADVAALSDDDVLVEHDGNVVLTARAGQIRNVLREIGRLREATFRPVGEGTGRAIDLDTFDYDYVHMFIWNPARRQVVGAYRLGQTDVLVAAKGRQGLYTSTLFNYTQALLDRMGPSLEMGRSFVRAEYQRSYAPLLMLWKGIGHYCVRHPRYRCLFGPVSISNSYRSVSKQLMVQFLRMRHAPDGPGGLVAPRNPFPLRRLQGWDAAASETLLCDSDEVSSLIADVEGDARGMPVLVRQYLKLGAKFHAFNVDPDFSDALDGLIEVDLTRTDGRVLERYMTKEGYSRFMSHHALGAAVTAPGASSCRGRTAALGFKGG